MNLKFFIFGPQFGKMGNEGFAEKYSALGRRIRKWLEGKELWHELDAAVGKGASCNVFFTPYMQRRALEAIAEGFLREDILSGWIGSYPPVCRDTCGKVCGVVAAGNIPAVAFHDILSVLAAGWHPLVKLSSKDRYLLPVLFPEVRFSATVEGWNVDALLTMGGDEAAGYFRSAFAGVPAVIRKGRFSAAVLTGRESGRELDLLAEDMLLYYGMGCRSVTCLLVPRGYDFTALSESADRFSRRYLGRLMADNHRKNRAVLTMAGENFIDSGSLIFRRPAGQGMSAGECRPYGLNLSAGEVWYAEYSSDNEVDNFICGNNERIQKIIRNFGSAQRPAVDDFPDGVDTVGFLHGLKQ